MKTRAKSLICTLLVTVIFIPLTSFKEVYAMEQRSDREQIIDVVNGVAMSADHRDWTAAQSYFMDEPFIDYSSLTGQPGSKVKAAELIKGWSAFLPKFKFTQHFISNHDVKIKGNTASCRSYVHAIHNLPYAEGSELWGVYGIYDHELIKTSSGWKVSKMTFHLLHQEGNKDIPALVAKIPNQQKVTFVSEGNKLTGILYTPPITRKVEKYRLSSLAAPGLRSKNRWRARMPKSSPVKDSQHWFLIFAATERAAENPGNTNPPREKSRT